jgi:hypothetical protein
MRSSLLARLLTILGVFVIFGTSLVTARKMSQAALPTTASDKPIATPSPEINSEPEIIEDVVYQEVPAPSLSTSVTPTKNQEFQKKEIEKEDDREDREED